MRKVCLAASAVATGAILFAASSAHADEMHLRINWSRALGEGYAWLQDRSGHKEQARPNSIPSQGSHSTLESSASELSDSLGDTWFGVDPNVSVVARDWSSSTLLTGKMSATDAMRLSHSCRMVLSRIRLGKGRFTPFAQVGLGQWRVDTDVVMLPSDMELAGQTGAGVEVHLAKHIDLAAESNMTILFRDTHEAQNIASPHIWGGFLAMRGTL